MTDATNTSSKTRTRTVHYKYEIKPTESHIDYLNQAFGHSRFVWNVLLSLYDLNDQKSKESKTDINGQDWHKDIIAKLRLHINDKKDYYFNPRGYLKSNETILSSLLTYLKSICPFLNDVSSVALQQKTRDLSGSISRFLSRKSGKPRFKTRKSKQSVRLTDNAFNVDELGNFTIAKMTNSPIKVYWSRPLASMPSSVTISKTPEGRYYVSFVVEEKLPEVIYDKKDKYTVTGFDLGIKSLMVDSDGNDYTNLMQTPRLLKLDRQIRRTQRRMSKSQKDSKSYESKRQRLNRLYTKVTNVRNDVYRKLAKAIATANDIIVLESLRVSNMVKNRRLSRAISRVAWSTLVKFVVEYVEKLGKLVVFVGQFFPSSKTCSVCGSKYKELTLKDREWTCPVCETHHHRDHNAAINIKDHILTTWSVEAKSTNMTLNDVIWSYLTRLDILV